MSLGTGAPRPPRRRRAGGLAVDAGVGVGVLPSPTALLRLRGGLHFGGLQLGGRASAWLPREVALADHPTVGGRFWLIALGLEAAAALPVGRRWEVSVRAAVDVGLYGARGVGDVVRPRSARAPWVALGLGAGLRLALGARAGLHAVVEGIVAPLRPRFEIEGAGAPCCDDILGGQAVAGVDVRLP